MDGDLSREKIDDKGSEPSLAEVPVLLVVGKREAEERWISMRRLGSQAQTGLSLDEALVLLGGEATAPDVTRGQREVRGQRVSFGCRVFENGNPQPINVLCSCLGSERGMIPPDSD